MDSLVITPLLITLLTWVAQIQPQVTFEGKGDYCQLETFNATCGHDEIIIMLSAHYGRMRPGRCITRSYGNLGCSADVLSVLDKKCSGRRSCTIEIPDPILHKSRPCPKDFTSYLEASYQCVRVLRGSNECETKEGAELDDMVLAAGEGFILGAIPDHPEDPSSIQCPWRIHGLPGQRINLTMISFHRDMHPNSPDSGGYHHVTQGQCVDVAMVAEDYRKETLQLCPSQGRERMAYLSTNSAIYFHTFSKTSTSRKGNVFLWKYKAIGCPDLEVGAGMWVRRTDDQMVVRCNQTEETWYLICQDGEWKGRLGNCSLRESRKLIVEEIVPSETTVPYGILITVAIGVALGIFLGGVLLVVVLVIRRYRAPNRRKPDCPYDGHNTLKKMELERGYAPVLDECGHFPVSAEMYSSTLSHTSQGGSGDPPTIIPPDAIITADGHLQNKENILKEPLYCVHHECHVYESTRLVYQMHPDSKQSLPMLISHQLIVYQELSVRSCCRKKVPQPFFQKLIKVSW